MQKAKQRFAFAIITVIVIALFRWLLQAFEWRRPMSIL